MKLKKISKNCHPYLHKWKLCSIERTAASLQDPSLCRQFVSLIVFNTRGAFRISPSHPTCSLKWYRVDIIFLNLQLNRPSPHHTCSRMKWWSCGKVLKWFKHSGEGLIFLKVSLHSTSIKWKPWYSMQKARIEPSLLSFLLPLVWMDFLHGK